MSVKGYRWFASLAVVAIVVVFALRWWARQNELPGPTAVSTNAPAQNLPRQPITQSPPPVATKADLADKFRAAASELIRAPDAAAKRQAMAALRQALSDGSTNLTPAAIRRFLDTRVDAPTGQGFKPAGKGPLAEAPTLRTFLLDQLTSLDPAAAAEYARTILGSPDSPDEWAVALKSLALGDTSPAGRQLLEQKTAELLRNDSWQQNPSTGYLEAFDTAVFLGGTNLAPALTDLVRKQDNPAVAHAAYLALDRLVINDTADLLAALQADPGLMQGREATRANYFARADVRDPLQRQVLESYLLDPRIGAAELAQFAGLFPSANYMISQNLLTPTPTPDRASLTARDATSLQTVQDWLADPRFTKLQPQLQRVKQRLEDFARQAGR